MLGRHLPTLCSLLALGAGIAGIAVELSRRFDLGAVLVLGVLVVDVRLRFCDLAVLLDDAGIVSALERSWGVTRGNWSRTVALGLVFVPVHALLTLLPAPVAGPVATLTEPVAHAILVCAYLQRTGRLTPAGGAAASALEPISAPDF